MFSCLGDLLAPTRCVACGVRSEPPWCPVCADRVTASTPACRQCGDRWADHRCPAIGSAWSRTTALWTYEGPVRAAVVGAKARGAWAGWEHLGDLLADGVEEALARPGGPPRPQLVTWVPGRPEVIRRRGIDHARVLADAVGALLGVEVAAFAAAGRAAGRRVDTPAHRRRSVVASGPAFHAPVDAQAAPLQVLLVDDVLTTGATVREVAGVLAAAGAEHVHVAVLARSGSDGPGEDHHGRR